MEIPEKTPLPSLSARNRPTEGLPQPSIKPTGVRPKSAQGDTVSLTKSGCDFKTTVQNAHLLPDIREARVLRIKRQLEEGTYAVKKDRIAVNMIDETLENHNVLKHLNLKG